MNMKKAIIGVIGLLAIAAAVTGIVIWRQQSW
jgi:cytochrome b subunit of formate dehydrogenase